MMYNLQTKDFYLQFPFLLLLEEVCVLFFLCCPEGLLRATNEVSFHQGLLLKTEEVERDWYFLRHNNLSTSIRKVAR